MKGKGRHVQRSSHNAACLPHGTKRMAKAACGVVQGGHAVGRVIMEVMCGAAVVVVQVPAGVLFVACLQCKCVAWW